MDENIIPLIILYRADETNDNDAQEKSIGVMKDSIYHQKAKKQWFKWVIEFKTKTKQTNNSL